MVRLILTLISCSLVCGLPDFCPSKCTCFQRISNCSGAALDQVPALPGATSITIDLSLNQIRALTNNTFLQHNVVYPETLYLNSNKLLAIQLDAFKGLRYLKTLDLSHNDLKSLDPRIFLHTVALRHLKINNNNFLDLSRSIPAIPNTNLPKINSLRVLELTGCMLDAIPTQWLNMFPRLLGLNLDQNVLKCLENDLFESNKYIRHLDLRNNLFETLNVNALSLLIKLSSVDLRFNPTNCDDCSITDFVAVLDINKNLNIYGHCFLPLPKKGTSLVDVTHCIKPTTTTLAIPTVIPTTEQYEPDMQMVYITPVDANSDFNLTKSRIILNELQDILESDEIGLGNYIFVLGYVGAFALGSLMTVGFVLIVMKTRKTCCNKDIV